MKEHKTNKKIISYTMERYEAAGYPQESLRCLRYLESRCERLGDFLEEFRHIQPGNGLFSVGSIGIIKELCELREHLHRLEEALFEMRSHYSESELPDLSTSTDDF